MATPLDIGVLQSFESLFPLLFVFLVVYGVISSTKILGDNKAVPALIAVILAIMTMFSTVAIRTINMMAPWFVLLFIFGIFLLITYQLFGVKEDAISGLWKGWDKGGSTVFYWILTIVVLIGLGSLMTVLGEDKGGFREAVGITNISEVPAGELGFWQTIMHPKVLGMVLLLLIALFAVKHLTAPSNK